MIRNTKQQDTSGFALLLTLVVVSVVLAIGLTLLDITLKQLSLSGTGRDSEIAFHTAYAGIECARYWRRQPDKEATLLGGAAPTFDWCLSGSSESGTYTEVLDNGDGQRVHLAQYEIDWTAGSGVDRCTQIDLYLYDASGGNDLTYDIDFYGEGSETCRGGSTCTILFSRGYNRSCGDIGTIRTVQREVVLRF